ncbi:hypothetical protein GGTG_02407 [Gaeumannomyces tritici R3-111a-1]|uniref:Minor extracellular protease vpr n=1 Tax=Gaeumannomyces tritici (strain R3-111a-1) TaxID=644352 RepID=J3NMA3_GAET3|nr:hypothetical protein GGTG_02407 [Gaeumannomyces tritici R3-111a-1]EJT82434.1 hypothetical protein GGTG_02407 [Gaeumannomyces tritici R3-111a-1]
MLGLALLLSVLGLARKAACENTAAAASVPAAVKQFIVEFGNGLLPRDLAADASVKLVKTYESPLFTGAVVELDSEGSAARFAAGKQVVNMWPNHVVALDEPLDVKSFLNDVSAVDYSVHKATGVDRLHAAGILGQGVKVAVVDTGVWHKHPALGGGFGPGFKVAGGWDFAGDATSPKVAKKPDADPLDQLGHGTHVAGIVAAVSDGFVGVAPNATLLAYKVIAGYGGTDAATIMDAWLRAYADGADVITTSIGSLVGWQDNALTVVGSRITRQGVIMTMSAGNNGADGAFYGSEAGSSDDVLAVASVQAEVSPATRYQLTVTLGGVSNTTQGGYMSDDVFSPDVRGWPVVALSMDPETAADACAPYPAGTQSLTGKVALVRRGGCTYAVKQRNLEALGCKNMLVYNDNRALTNPGSTLPTSTMAMITAPAGHAIIKALAAGAAVTVDFSRGGGLVGQPDALGGTPSTFSSWAATYDLLLKPDVAAPGGNIFSTWLDGEFQVQSGTSMATPYMAGIAALYISALGGRDKHGPNFALDFNRRVIASGKSLPWYDGTTKSDRFLAPSLQIGGGLVNASRVLYAGTTLDKAKISLNDTRNFQGVHEVTVTNAGASAVAYNFTLEPAAGFEVLDPFMRQWDTWGMKTFASLSPLDLVPDVQLPEPFSLGPGESKKVTVAFANPEAKGWNATVIPTYSGKLLVRGDNGDALSLPYLGVAASLYETKKVWRNTYPLAFGGEPWTSIDVKSNYTFNLTTGVRDYPFVFMSFDWGVRELRWDVFEADWAEDEWRYPPESGGAKGFVGAVAVWEGELDPAFEPPTDLSDPAVNGQVTPMPARFLSRFGMTQPSDKKWHWLGKMADGKQIAPGNYTMRVAVSRPLADLSRADGWEVWRRAIQVLPMK